MGAAQSLTFGHSPAGTQACFASLGDKLHRVRARRSAGVLDEEFAFDEADRSAQDLPLK